MDQKLDGLYPGIDSLSHASKKPTEPVTAFESQKKNSQVPNLPAMVPAGQNGDQ